MSSEVDDVSFPKTISNLLKEGNTLQALTLFTDNKNSEEVHSNSWDLVPVVAHYLTENYEYNDIEVFKCCQKLINIIAENSKPEEVLLQFIEEIELAKDDTKFLMLLKPLQIVLLRVPDKRITSLAWCFNAIKNYLDKLETPEDLNLVGEERLLLDANEIVNRITYLYNELLSFSGVFVEELVHAHESAATFERKQVIRKFLLELLGTPLAFLDMDTYKNTKPKARIIAETLIEKIFCLTSDPYLYLENRGGTSSDLVIPNYLSLGIFFYLMMSEEVCLKFAPKIYNSVYIFNNCLNLVNQLLTQDGQFVVEKGVHLADALLKNINHLELSYLLLDSEHHSKFCKTLSNIIVHNECENIRKKCLHILQTYLWSFEHQGRYLIITNLLPNLNHSGLKGNVITQYKEMIIQEVRTRNFDALPRYYKGWKLFCLLDQFTRLKHQEKTDLINESDQIVSTLNLLRYLLLADKNGDTSIDHYCNILEKGYLTHLKTGIEISKEHYHLKIKQITEECGDVNVDDSDCKVSVTVSGQDLVEMSTERKIEILNLSLTTLDVIDCLLSRVVEIIMERHATV